MNKVFTIILLGIFILIGCKSNDNKVMISDDKEFAKNAILFNDSSTIHIKELDDRYEDIKKALSNKVPVLLLKNSDSKQLLAQNIALADKKFTENLIDKDSKKPFRNEIFNVYLARPQEIPNNCNPNSCYKIEMYNYALNITTTAFVDIDAKRTCLVNSQSQSQPDIPDYLKDLALKIAVNSSTVIKELGYKPEEKDAMMANTKTALNKTKCERSYHLCVAPTFVKGDKALWVIVDLTDNKIVGLRWTNVGNAAPPTRIGERNLKFEKIMECYCKKVNSIEKRNWKLNYIITSSDGLRISEVYFNNRMVINNAKVVDWHVNYSKSDGFGYSDAVGCPEFSQAVVIATLDPIISDIIKDGKVVGFAIEQVFNSELWPFPCNYEYMQRFEFYDDGKFRPIAANHGRGCGSDGTYRPVTRISFTGSDLTLYEWNEKNWNPWKTEQWKLQTETTRFTPEGYLYKISNAENKGYFLEPNIGQFNDGGRGDFAYLFATKQHLDRDEGEKDMVSIGPCCNIDYHQGPEKFIEPNPESIENSEIVLWYVAQMKNDDRKGNEYCWSERYLENGIYKSRVYPCLSGPMFIPIK